MFVSQARGSAVNHPTGELPAGCVDVLAARAPDRGEHAAPHELIAEALDHLRRRALKARIGKGIEGNEIDLGGMSLEKRGERARLTRRIVDSGEHHIFERDAAAVLLIDVMPAGVEQFGYRMLPIDRPELASQRIVACMQRYGERAVDLPRELAGLRRKR